MKKRVNLQQAGFCNVNNNLLSNALGHYNIWVKDKVKAAQNIEQPLFKYALLL